MSKKLSFVPIKKIMGPFKAFLDLYSYTDLIEQIYSSSYKLNFYKCSLSHVYLISTNSYSHRIIIWLENYSTIYLFCGEQGENLFIPFQYFEKIYYLTWGEDDNTIDFSNLSIECIKNSLHFSFKENHITNIYKNNIKLEGDELSVIYRKLSNFSQCYTFTYRGKEYSVSCIKDINYITLEGKLYSYSPFYEFVYIEKIQTLYSIYVSNSKINDHLSLIHSSLNCNCLVSISPLLKEHSIKDVKISTLLLHLKL
jgi:hypothetical protein